eukprot:ctg_235.g144
MPDPRAHARPRGAGGDVRRRRDRRGCVCLAPAAGHSAVQWAFGGAGTGAGVAAAFPLAPPGGRIGRGGEQWVILVRGDAVAYGASPWELRFQNEVAAAAQCRGHAGEQEEETATAAAAAESIATHTSVADKSAADSSNSTPRMPKWFRAAPNEHDSDGCLICIDFHKQACRTTIPTASIRWPGALSAGDVRADGAGRFPQSDGVHTPAVRMSKRKTRGREWDLEVDVAAEENRLPRKLLQLLALRDRHTSGSGSVRATEQRGRATQTPRRDGKAARKVHGQAVSNLSSGANGGASAVTPSRGHRRRDGVRQTAAPRSAAARPPSAALTPTPERKSLSQRRKAYLLARKRRKKDRREDRPPSTADVDAYLPEHLLYVPLATAERRARQQALGKLDGRAADVPAFDKELRAVGVGAGVGHGQQAAFGVLLGEVLVGKLAAVDAAAASAVPSLIIASLHHEPGDDAVRRAALVPTAGGAGRLTGAQLPKVLRSARGHVGEQLADDTARWLSGDVNVQVYFGIGHGAQEARRALEDVTGEHLPARRLAGGGGAIHSDHVKAHRLAERAALADGDNIALVKSEARRGVAGNVAVALLVALVFGTPVEIVPPHDHRAGHLGAHHYAAQDPAAYTHIASKRALFVDVAAFDGLSRRLDAQADRLVPTLAGAAQPHRRPVERHRILLLKRALRLHVSHGCRVHRWEEPALAAAEE